MSFDSFALRPELLRGVADLGFTQPTPIQRQAIPPALQGRDVLACAMTGSGKTAAFALPILQRLLATSNAASSRRTRALILSPTRELAAQIDEHVRDLARHTRLSSAAIFGGVGMEPQVQAFRRGVDVLTATPGRLLDHFQHPYARLDHLEVLVLDEADRMLDMGFLPDIRRVLRHLHAGPRQTLFFSATMPAPIAELAREMLHAPVSINIERPAAPAVGITHAVYPVRADLKVGLLRELLTRHDLRSVLVFTRTKHRANRLAEQLARHGVACDRIHGNRSQSQRTAALAAFKAGGIRVLVATDIAARGIDVDALSHVVNFDVPNLAEDYIHRVGRTARADARGDAITFVAPDEEADLAGIERALGKRLPRTTVAGFDYGGRPTERLEIPLGERIAAIRARKADERARARANAERRARNLAAPPRRELAAPPRAGQDGVAPPRGGRQRVGPSGAPWRPSPGHSRGR